MHSTFVLTGGGTGGHVYPALAVATELRARGSRILYLGIENKIEARIVPEAGFDIRFLRSGALNRVSFATRLRSAAQIPLGVLDAWRVLKQFKPQGIFSTGGYVAGPVMVAAIIAGVPFVVMEANATPGFANRLLGRFAARALLGFESAVRWFPAGRAEVTGLPVRNEFFETRPKNAGPFTVLITGGSQGSRTLNRAALESWPLLRAKGTNARIIHQCGLAEHNALAQALRESGLEGEVLPFVRNMADAFAEADLVVARAGAGSVNEIAAAGMASVLVPLPFAADDHQRKNAEALVNAGAARMVLDAEMNGTRLVFEIERAMVDPESLARMRERVRQFSHPGAAKRAADVLENLATATQNNKSPVDTAR